MSLNDDTRRSMFPELKAEVGRLTDRLSALQPRLAELEAENIRLEGDLEKVEGCLKKAHERIRAERAKLEELLAAAQEAGDLVAWLSPSLAKRVAAAVAAFEERK